MRRDNLSADAMMERTKVAFVVLVAGDAGVEMARIMEAHLNPECDLETQVYLPSVRGMAYFDADVDQGRRLDREWADHLDPARTIPVFVMQHEPGLEEFVPGLTGELVVGVPDARTRKLYENGREEAVAVQTVIDTDPTVLMEFAMQCYLGEKVEDQAFAGYDFPTWWLDSPPPWEAGMGSDIEMLTEDEAWGRRLPEDTPTTTIDRVIAEGGADVVADDADASAAAGTPQILPEHPKRPGQEELDNLIELAKKRPDPVVDKGSPAGDADAIAFEELPAHIQSLPPGLRPKGIADWLRNRAQGGAADEVPPMEPLPDTLLGFVSRAAWPAAPHIAAGPLEAPVASGQASPTRILPPVIQAKGTAGKGIMGMVEQARGAAGGLLKMERKFKPPAELTQMLVEVAPLRVGVGSRKGGVGKTNDAAGMACVFGEALVLRGGKCVLVDGNIGNPASWAATFPKGREDATVTKVVEALMSGQVPPDPAWARTPGLAGYREDRAKGEGYAAGEISELDDLFRKLYQATVVDLHNSLPNLGGAEEEVVLHWMHHIDVLVVPTDSDPDSVTAVHEFVDEIHKLVESWGEDAPPLPVVVAYLSPPSRELRELPALRQALAALAERVQAIVEIPYDDKARIALWGEEDILSVSPKLAKAYTELALAVAKAAVAVHRL